MVVRIGCSQREHDSRILCLFYGRELLSGDLLQQGLKRVEENIKEIGSGWGENSGTGSEVRRMLGKRQETRGILSPGCLA